MMPVACTVIESPCIRVCVVDAMTGHCRGCRRTRDEISFWMRYTSEERRRVSSRVEARRATAPAGAR